MLIYFNLIKVINYFIVYLKTKINYWCRKDKEKNELQIKILKQTAKIFNEQ